MKKVLPVTESMVVDLTNKILGTDFKHYRDLEDKMFAVKERLHGQWLSSGCTDFSVYHDPEYIYEAIHCFEKTKACTTGAIRYFKGYMAENVSPGSNRKMPAAECSKYFEGDWKKLTYLDVYNGNGLTTFHMMLNGFIIEAFNDCKPQVDYMQRACALKGMPEVVVHDKMPTKQYDVVMSFEVLEHYTDPMAHVTELVKLTAPGGYLVESSGFNGSSINIGHFNTYTINGQVLSYRAARRLVTKEIQKHYTKILSAFNGTPAIWKLK